ncbi:hypothetical protein [Laceyella putida]|uniref:Uncharacterized protein n=1 Tax=Laceyella putida TaxID=110101 RepID=A0ABW2RFC8_9BACL
MSSEKQTFLQLLMKELTNATVLFPLLFGLIVSCFLFGFDWRIIAMFIGAPLVWFLIIYLIKQNKRD